MEKNQEPRLIWRNNDGPIAPPADHEEWRAAIRKVAVAALNVTLADRGGGAWFVAVAEERGPSQTPVDRVSDVVAALKRAGKNVTN